MTSTAAFFLLQAGGGSAPSPLFQLGIQFALILGLAFRQLGGALVRSEAQSASFWRAVLGGVFGGLVVFCVHNLFDSLFVHSVNVQVGVLLGLGLLAIQRLAAARPGMVAT